MIKQKLKGKEIADIKRLSGIEIKANRNSQILIFEIPMK